MQEDIFEQTKFDSGSRERIGGIVVFFTLLILFAGSGYADSGNDKAVDDSWSGNDQSGFIIQANN